MYHAFLKYHVKHTLLTNFTKFDDPILETDRCGDVKQQGRRVCRKNVRHTLCELTQSERKTTAALSQQKNTEALMWRG